MNENPQPVTFTEIVARARDIAAMTFAEFDYALQNPHSHQFGERAVRALGAAIDDAANEGYPQVTEGCSMDILREHEARRRVLRAELAPQVDALIAAARAKSYTGWSSANAAPIRYTEESS